jgi:hypothetical protein
MVEPDVNTCCYLTPSSVQLYVPFLMKYNIATLFKTRQGTGCKNVRLLPLLLRIIFVLIILWSSYNE